MPSLELLFAAATWISFLLAAAILSIVFLRKGRYRSEAGRMAFINYMHQMRLSVLILIASMMVFLLGETAEFLANSFPAYPMERAHLALEVLHLYLASLSFVVILSIVALVERRLK